MTDVRTPTSEASAGELILQASDDISRLIRDEMALARRDLAESGKRLGKGVGMFGAAGTLALYGIAAAIATVILAIAQTLDPWLAALIVTAALFVAAGIAALLGRRSLNTMAEPPKQRVESVKADVATATHRAEGDSQ